MRVTADLHIHGRFSQATSNDLDIKNLEKYAKLKGVTLLGSGDFTHPKWVVELKENLVEEQDGVYRTATGFPFILQTEISLIYSQGGKGRRIHNIVLAPDFDVVGQITEYLLKHGRVDYDGRPIFKIPCPEFVESLKKISDKIEVIPAHCLLPGTNIHSNPKLKKIEEIKKNDNVLTHRGRFRRVLNTYNRFYKGKVYRIVPWYFREGLITTAEHPFYIIKSVKRCSWIKGTCKPLCSQRDYCKKKYYNNYLPEWIQAKDIEKGDFVVYPRIRCIKDKDKIKISDVVKDLNIIKKGTRTKYVKNEISIDKDFCRLAGYYLAEGYVIRNEAIGFSFNKKEKEYIEDVAYLMNAVFGMDQPKFDYRKGMEIIFYSHVLNRFFRNLFYSYNEKKAWTKSIPHFMLFLPVEKQAELLRGWWRGDAGYTVSHCLANQMKIVCIRLGIIPSISIDSAEKFNARGNHFIGKRKISTSRDTFIFSNLSFFENKELLRDKSFKRFANKRNMKHGWVDKENIYLPVRKIEAEEYEGQVYNLEVDEDNSYVPEFAAVHNCWTPWFSLFGSMSGFDTVRECFGDQTKEIHALETGLSSDPAMNWRLSQLDKYALVSFSDLHSYWPWRIGREATIFDIELTYDNILKALRTKEGLSETIEVDPNYGKYHFDGHRNCKVSLSPAETRKHKGICPVCGKALTIGVLNRVEELADRPEGFVPENAVPFRSLIPLSEIISKVLGKGIMTKSVWKEFDNLIKAYGSELNVLLDSEFAKLTEIVGEKIARAIIDIREGRIKIKPGYDGEYGVPIFSEEQEKKKGIEIKPRQVQTDLSDY